MIIDGGECEVGLESTVIDLTGEKPMLLRPGAVTLSELCRVLGDVSVNPKISEEVDDGEKVASPGMKYKHYSPEAPVVIVDGDAEAFVRYVIANSEEKKVAVLCFDEEKMLFSDTGINAVSYGSKNNPGTLAHGLFSALRILDEMSVDIIYAREPETSDGMEQAVVNRLGRAAAFNRISV